MFSSEEFTRVKPALLLVGPGRSGKDEAGVFLHNHTVLDFGGTTSRYLLKHMAIKLGCTEEEAYANRHSNRMEWYNHGNFLRQQDPGMFVKEALLSNDITGGIRSMEEAEWCRENRDIVDLIIWIDNPHVPQDPTLMFGSSMADIIIPNRGTLAEYHERLEKFAKSLGIWLEETKHG